MASKKVTTSKTSAGKAKRAAPTEASASIKTSAGKAKRAAPTEASASIKTRESQNRPFPVVGIGASAGGLEAFRQLLEHLPTDTGMAFVLVQHLDPKRESILAELLSKA